jgi:RNA polymerase sigma factor (sigma-70 family)
MNGSDAQLLQHFARSGCDEAFCELVRRQVDLVYSTAVRVVAGDAELAKDVTQTVFADLAAKAAQLPADTVVAGWLYQATRFAAAKAVRTEQRRRARETAALEALMIQPDPAPDWEQLRPLLDTAMDSLSAADRDALVLRYFQRKELREVGTVLGVSDEAARKRVSRALDQLRDLLARRGVTTTAGALATVIATHAVHAAPVGLAAAVSAASLVGLGVGTTAFSLKLLPALVMTKSQTLVTAAVLAAGVATPLVWQHRQLSDLRQQNAALLERTAELDSQLAQQVGATKRPVAVADSDQSRRQQEELLRLRGEVAQLRTQNTALAKNAGAKPAKPAGRTRPATPPSSQPGYVPAAEYAFAGYATPQAALQSYFWALENPRSGKLLETLALPESVRQMLPTNVPADIAFTGQRIAVKTDPATGELAVDSKDVHPLPEDGQTLGLTAGYRTLSEADLAPDRKQVEVEREFPDGTVRNETHTLSKVGDEWKVQPGAGMQVMAVRSDGNGVTVGGDPGDGGQPIEQHVDVRISGPDEPQP